MSPPSSDPELTAPGSSFVPGVPFSARFRWFLLVALVIFGWWFFQKIGTIIWPFLWALLIAYLVLPLVNFCNERLRIPRLVVLLGLLVVLVSLGILGARWFIPWLQQQLTLFAEDLPKLEGSLISKVGPKPFGIKIDAVFKQLADKLHPASNAKASIHLLTSAVGMVVRFIIFLFTTIYLVVDAPRIRGAMPRLVPVAYRDEIIEVVSRINTTWMRYIRGELVLFVIMSIASFIALRILQVPGAAPLAITTGGLELVPLIGPYTAGALAVSVAYLNGTNPFGWSQITYGLVVAAVYLGLREAEDYIVIPRVLGHAVKLHPLVILFSLAAGGVVAGIFGLLVAVPVAASLKIVGAYVYDKLVGQSEFTKVHGVETFGGHS